MSQRWNTDRVRMELGLKTINSASRALHRMGVKPIGREPGRDGMNEYDADEVTAKIAARPGRGRKADLKSDDKVTKG